MLVPGLRHIRWAGAGIAEQEEKGLEGEGGTQVPVYTARWGLGAVCWPGCREERESSE